MKNKNPTPFFVFVFFKLFLIGLLASCAGREKQKDDIAEFSGNAKFLVDVVTKPLNLDSIMLNTREGLPHSFSVNLRTCIKDAIRKDVSIQNTPFFIEYETNILDSKNQTPSLHEVKALSDSNGCIQWQEEYRFRFVRHPWWIGLRRTIKTKSNAYSGQIVVPMAVNPWLTESDKGRPAILDVRPQYSKNHKILKDKYIKNGLAFLSKKPNKAEFPQLWVPEVAIQIETVPQEAINNKFENPKSSSSLLSSVSKVNEVSKEREKEEEIKSLLKPYQTICTGPFQRNCYKRYLKLVTTVPLQLRRYNTKGEMEEDKLNGGVYDVSIQLVVVPEANREMTYRIHEKICEHQGEALSEEKQQQTKFLSLNCNVKVPFFNKNAIYQLLVQVKPSDGSRLPFKLFQGAYTLKVDLSGSKKFITIDNDLDQKYKEVLKGKKSNIDIIGEMKIKNIYDLVSSLNEDDLKTENLSINAFFNPQMDGENYFTFASLKNTTNCKKNENVVERPIQFTGKVCLEDTLQDKTYTQTSFRIFVKKQDIEGKQYIEEIFDSKSSGKKHHETGPYGCIFLSIFLRHKVYDRQRYFPVDIYFLSEHLNLYGHVRPALNPWQRAFQAHQDATKIHKDDIRFETGGVKKPELVITQFKSVNLFPSYGLDKFLNISLYHRIYFLFQPFIKRHDNVALGLDHRARELLRDGYYIVRLLLLRNPQETLHLSRVLNKGDIDEERENKILNEKFNFDISNAEYITHIDTVAKAEANFVNLHMPLYLTTQQFYYVASRNLISIEIVPADPAFFTFKEVKGDEFCELDMQKTRWKPFFDHELINHPYIGAFNIQNWINWNILKFSSKLNSDKLIEQSEIGRKYKHFNISRSMQASSEGNESDSKQASSEGIESKSKNIPLACISGEEKGWDQEPIHKQISKCGSNSGLPASIKDSIQKEKIDPLVQQDILKEFAKQNALKIVDLSKQEGDYFIDDLAKARGQIIWNSYYLKPSEILPLIPDNDRQNLEAQIDEKCFFDWGGFFPDEKCHHKIIEGYIDEREWEQKTTTNPSKGYSSASTLEKIKATENYYNFSTNDESKIKIDKETVEKIIDKRVNNQNAKRPEVFTFVKSLCYFWFDSYLKDYLEKEQMISAYTNYIRKLDYYKILETNSFSGQKKLSFFDDFVRIVGIADYQTESEKSLFDCHNNYAQCIGSDHCQLNAVNNIKNDYCRHFPKEEQSCKKVLKQECEKNPSFPLCGQKNTSCPDSLNSFCEINASHSICPRFSSRCLVDYHSCMQFENTKGLFDSESIVNFDYVDRWPYYIDMFRRVYKGEVNFLNTACSSGFIKKPYTKEECLGALYSPLNRCLENPYQFFKFENKMLVHEMSQENPVYKGGYLQNFGVTGAFSLGSYMNWTAQSGHSNSVKGGIGVSVPGISLGMDIIESMSSNVSNSNRRAIDVRSAEAVFLTIGRAKIEVNVTKFQKCLVVKPRPNAFFSSDDFNLKTPTNFSPTKIWSYMHTHLWKSASSRDFQKVLVSRPGLILCNPLEERNRDNAEKITEDYFYISQTMEPTNSQFLNLYDLANRPFVNLLRGRKEIIKFYHMFRGIIEGDNGDINDNFDIYSEPPGNMFIHYTFPIEESVGLSLTIREFNETGFYPGVYDYSEDSDEELDAIFTKEGSGSRSVFNSIRNNLNIMYTPSPPVKSISVQ